MNHFPEKWGRPRDDVYGQYDHSYLHSSMPTTRPGGPMVTGTSVVSLKFKDGVVIAADNLASYGSLARFRDVQRIKKFNKRAVLGLSGDVSDMQHIFRIVDELLATENYSSSSPSLESDAENIDAKNLYTYLSKLMYQRRSNFDPLWNQVIVGGLDFDDNPFLASVDLRGTSFSAPTLATGFGSQLAIPILRKLVPDEQAAAKLSMQQAVDAIKEAMKVLFYRDARSIDKYSMAIVSKDFVSIDHNIPLERQSWKFAEAIRGYGTQVN